MMNRKILSMTLKELQRASLDEILIMIENNLEGIAQNGEEYALSIASAIVRKIISLNQVDQYDKFYQIIMSKELRSNEYICQSFEKMNLTNLLDVYTIYDSEKDLIDYILCDDKNLFDELMRNNYDLKKIFNRDLTDQFLDSSYKLFLSYLNGDIERKRVVNALLKDKNDKFLEIVIKMDDVILQYTENDKSFFDAILMVLNYNNYRKLLWDYYQNYYRKDANKYSSELRELINYAMSIMEFKYSMDYVPEIVTTIKKMMNLIREGKDIAHISVFGTKGYERVKDKTFDEKTDFPPLNDENGLLNLKISFFSFIYGISYDQAQKIVSHSDQLLKNNSNGDRMIKETILAMKNLYDLTLEDQDRIRLYREVYHRYIVKNGPYASVEVPAVVIMEELMRKTHNISLELL